MARRKKRQKDIDILLRVTFAQQKVAIAYCAVNEIGHFFTNAVPHTRTVYCACMLLESIDICWEYSAYDVRCASA